MCKQQIKYVLAAPSCLSVDLKRNFCFYSFIDSLNHSAGQPLLIAGWGHKACDFGVMLSRTKAHISRLITINHLMSSNGTDQTTVGVQHDRLALNSISSDYFRCVDRSMNISGRIPNAIFTLVPSTTLAIFCAIDSSSVRADVAFLCRKFYFATRTLDKGVPHVNNAEFQDIDGNIIRQVTTVVHSCGRLFCSGATDCGQCGVGVIDDDEIINPRLIRLPAVLQVWHHRQVWFAKTALGLYGWGRGKNGQVGVGIEGHDVDKPAWVTDADVITVNQCVNATFFKISGGWLACGRNNQSQLGFPRSGPTPNVTRPTPVPDSSDITRWKMIEETTFAWSTRGLLACGKADAGRCGIGDAHTETVTFEDGFVGLLRRRARRRAVSYTVCPTLTPVALPDDVKGRVDRVVGSDESIYAICHNRCFTWGGASYERLGLPAPLNEHDTMPVTTPEEITASFPIDNIAVTDPTIVFISRGKLFGLGNNQYRIIASTGDRLTTPTPIDTPGPFTRVVLMGHINIYVRLTDGTWVGRGDQHPRFKPTLFWRARPHKWRPVSRIWGGYLDSEEGDHVATVQRHDDG